MKLDITIVQYRLHKRLRKAGEKLGKPISITATVPPEPDMFVRLTGSVSEAENYCKFVQSSFRIEVGVKPNSTVSYLMYRNGYNKNTKTFDIVHSAELLTVVNNITTRLSKIHYFGQNELLSGTDERADDDGAMELDAKYIADSLYESFKQYLFY